MKFCSPEISHDTEAFMLYYYKQQELHLQINEKFLTRLIVF